MTAPLDTDDSVSVVSAPALPEAGGITSLLRLRRWTRPHRKVITFMVVTACGAMLAQSLVPLVIGRVVDGPIRHHHTSGIYGLAGLALALGLAEATLF